MAPGCETDRLAAGCVPLGQPGHLDGDHGAVLADVVAAGALGAGQGLVEVLGGEHAEDDRHAGRRAGPAGCPRPHSPATDS